jgi:hypothetical protein
MVIEVCFKAADIDLYTKTKVSFAALMHKVSERFKASRSDRVNQISAKLSGTSEILRVALQQKLSKCFEAFARKFATAGSSTNSFPGAVELNMIVSMLATQCDDPTLKYNTFLMDEAFKELEAWRVIQAIAVRPVSGPRPGRIFFGLAPRPALPRGPREGTSCVLRGLDARVVSSE